MPELFALAVALIFIGARISRQSGGYQPRSGHDRAPTKTPTAKTGGRK